MKKIEKLQLGLAFVCMLVSAPAAVAESDVDVEVRGDLVSSYVWRGMYQAGMSFQPTLGIGYKGLSLTAWGSTPIDGDMKEVDLIAGYKFSEGLTISITDYWVTAQGTDKYFNYSSHSTAHQFEAGISYDLPIESFPLSLSWSTMFAGNDYNANGKRAFSSYIDMKYPFSIKAVDMSVGIGIVPFKSQYTYQCDGLAVTNISARGTYTIHAGEYVDLPIFSELQFNPRLSDAHVIFGISIVPKL